MMNSADIREEHDDQSTEWDRKISICCMINYYDYNINAEITNANMILILYSVINLHFKKNEVVF